MNKELADERGIGWKDEYFGSTTSFGELYFFGEEPSESDLAQILDMSSSSSYEKHGVEAAAGATPVPHTAMVACMRNAVYEHVRSDDRWGNGIDDVESALEIDVGSMPSAAVAPSGDRFFDFYGHNVLLCRRYRHPIKGNSDFQLLLILSAFLRAIGFSSLSF